MSSVNWQKIKTKSEGKAKIAHNATETRLERNHSNKHINKEKTYLNLNLDGRTYVERCLAYDERVNHCKSNMKRVRRDAVTLIGLNVKLPDGLVYADYDLQCSWCRDVYAIMRDFCGDENIVSATADFDEVHEYFDPDTKQYVLSRPELDIKFVPVFDDKLCAKKWETKGRMTMLNNFIEEMTQAKYSMYFLTGKGGKNLSAEELKAESVRAEAEYKASEIIKEAKEASDKLMSETDEQVQSYVMQIKEKIEFMNNWKKELADKEKRLALQEMSIQDRTKAIERKEKEFQHREDALEAQEKALEERKRHFAEEVRKEAQRWSESDSETVHKDRQLPNLNW